MLPPLGKAVYTEVEDPDPLNVKTRVYNIVHKITKDRDQVPHNDWQTTGDSSQDQLVNGAFVASELRIPSAPSVTIIETPLEAFKDAGDQLIETFESNPRAKTKRSAFQEVATEVGVATLKHYIKKFDLVPKMLKKILDPGTLRGGPQFNHYR